VAVVTRTFFDVADIREHLCGQALATADGAQTNAVFHHLADFRAQIATQQPHERVDLSPRPLPVLRRERVQRQPLHADLASRLHDLPNGLLALAVTADTSQSAPRSPAPVAIHDDGDVSRQSFWGQFGQTEAAVTRP
jgi:hypothetical protein